jgi:hypothetical protein
MFFGWDDEVRCAEFCARKQHGRDPEYMADGSCCDNGSITLQQWRVLLGKTAAVQGHLKP